MVELGDLGRPELTPSSSQDRLGEGEDVVTVDSTLLCKALLLGDGDLSNMPVKTACHEDTNEGRDQWNGGIPGRHNDGVTADAWDLGIPDFSPGDQRSLVARHAATEKLESWLISSSWPGSLVP